MHTYVLCMFFSADVTEVPTYIRMYVHICIVILLYIHIYFVEAHCYVVITSKLILIDVVESIKQLIAGRFGHVGLRPLCTKQMFDMCIGFLLPLGP